MLTSRSFGGIVMHDALSLLFSIITVATMMKSIFLFFALLIASCMAFAPNQLPQGKPRREHPLEYTS
jgi:hypothetical protein